MVDGIEQNGLDTTKVLSNGMLMFESSSVCACNKKILIALFNVGFSKRSFCTVVVYNRAYLLHRQILLPIGSIKLTYFITVDQRSSTFNFPWATFAFPY